MTRDNDPDQELFLAWDDTCIDIFRSKLLKELSILDQLVTDRNRNSINESVSKFTVFMQNNSLSVYSENTG
jgi:hypothetical protein